tara:strand:+ start:64 stop:309 length:246 start_codon:yes stop_codon:yes gene_type:complete
MRGSSLKFCAIIFAGEKTKKQSTEKITNILGMVLKRNIYIYSTIRSKILDANLQKAFIKYFQSLNANLIQYQKNPKKLCSI